MKTKTKTLPTDRSANTNRTSLTGGNMARSPRAPQKSLEDALQRVQSQIEEKKREIVGLEREQKQLEEAIEVLSR